MGDMHDILPEPLHTIAVRGLMPGSLSSLKKLMPSYYRRPFSDTEWSLERFVGSDKVRYFSYGRHALHVALVSIGIGKGDRVLVPGFICRDLLASINSLGAIPEFYAVGKDLQLAGPQESLPHARAIIAVNYFGFAQDMRPFKAYCHRTGSVLIEDNAHGLLSRDGDGNVLGTRGDFGIFSLRKTVSMPDGAALLLNDSAATPLLPGQMADADKPVPFSFRAKELLRRLVPYAGSWLPRSITALGRSVRRLRTGYEIAPSMPDAETRLPGNPAPTAALGRCLAHFDADFEIGFRRDLYRSLEAVISEAGGEAVFDGLPEHTVPYGFPFRAKGRALQEVMRALSALNLECHPWPELPAAVAPDAPEYYKTVWMVKFLW